MSDQRRIYEEYQHYLDVGVAREIARANLPLSIYTEWYWKIDLHNLFHFLHLRLDAHAQKEIRTYADAVAFFVKRECPTAWEAFEEHVLYATKLSRSETEALSKTIEENNLWTSVEENRLEQLKTEEASDTRIEREIADLKTRLFR